ncbi:hypothetical protein GCM10010442_75890 [Kitasatospora kifunensis]
MPAWPPAAWWRRSSDCEPSRRRWPAPLAEKGYIGAGIGIRVPVRCPKGRSEKALDIDTRTTNALIRHVRALGERTAAELKEHWRTLKRISLNPHTDR